VKVLELPTSEKLHAKGSLIKHTDFGSVKHLVNSRESLVLILVGLA